MASTRKTFYCLRCQHRFDADFDPKLTVERSCQKCGSNSVRAETKLSAEAHFGPKPELQEN